MGKEGIYEKLKQLAELASERHYQDYFEKSHEKLMMAKDRHQQFNGGIKLGINEQLTCTETNSLLEEIDPMSQFLSECHSTIIQKENEQIENILRHWIDDPIVGPITKESLMSRCIRTILYKEPHELYSQCEKSGNNITIKISSLLLGVVQGDYLIGIDGQKSRLTEEQNKRLFEMGV